MIAVAYSGSHQADWRLATANKTIASFKTNGINPQFNDEKSILQLLNKNINLIHHAEEVKKLYFFSAGISRKDLKDLLVKAFGKFFKNAKVYIGQDMQAAAVACCKNNAGIICICGSGTNAGWYDGKKLKPNNYGLGYILADEGSANWLGRQLIKAFMNETLPAQLRQKFEHRYEADRKTILEKVYRQKQPALFLSSFTDFYVDNLSDPFLQNKVLEGFNLLTETYLLPLKQQNNSDTVHFTGSIASLFPNELRQAAEKAGIEVGTVLREPINNLLTYYITKN
ncbi:hypothetical protein MUY27_06085 [Mucilaginibacter sp. RS28]|uniref:BadF-type ATPase n=1 Tax=Mucilaginibacter straminoryzae TaxID=2932774 RepID=A0A9X1X608_9SPHI|nr:hypothetical protein [Mucilaginibacter straminoryzae]MCJ8209269.1 hypothetical protein [Mucilaginibacter straminoryzae]